MVEGDRVSETGKSRVSTPNYRGRPKVFNSVEDFLSQWLFFVRGTALAVPHLGLSKEDCGL
jgi:hypothetical protein